MKVILGLGNPGQDYAETRHNVGWWVVDHLADAWRLEGWHRIAWIMPRPRKHPCLLILSDIGNSDDRCTLSPGAKAKLMHPISGTFAPVDAGIA